MKRMSISSFLSSLVDPKVVLKRDFVDGRLLEWLKVGVNVGGHTRTAPTTLQYVTGQL